MSQNVLKCPRMSHNVPQCPKMSIVVRTDLLTFYLLFNIVTTFSTDFQLFPLFVFSVFRFPYSVFRFPYSVFPLLFCEYISTVQYILRMLFERTYVIMMYVFIFVFLSFFFSSFVPRGRDLWL